MNPVHYSAATFTVLLEATDRIHSRLYQLLKTIASTDMDVSSRLLLLEHVRELRFQLKSTIDQVRRCRVAELDSGPAA